MLLTDGEVGDGEVTRLACLAEQEAVTQVPVILLITGGRYSTPDSAEISVGVRFFAAASDALILYKSIADGILYVIDAKGVFQGLSGTKPDLSRWEKLPRFTSEKAMRKELELRDITLDRDRSHRMRREISLGPVWDARTDHALVKVNELLDQGQITFEDLRDLLQEETIPQLALACKTRGKLNDLRHFLIRNKQQEMLVQLKVSAHHDFHSRCL